MDDATRTASAPVVVIGDALIDELHDGTSTVELVGGAALNVAVGLVRLGVPATLIAMVGGDEAGQHIRSYLADYGVGLLATPSRLGTSRAVSTRTAGEPVYVFNDAARARHVEFGAAERAALQAAPLVAVSCFPFDDGRQVDALIDALGDRTVAVDPNPRTGMLRDAAAFATGFERLARRAALVKIGADDAALLYGTTLDAAAAQVAGFGADVVLATAGAAGASLQAGGTTVTAPVTRLRGPIVDTMGAGDAVFASVVASLVQDAPATAPAWAATLERAMGIAAATVRFEGALLRTPAALDGVDLDRLGT